MKNISQCFAIYKSLLSVFLLLSGSFLKDTAVVSILNFFLIQKLNNNLKYFFYLEIIFSKNLIFFKKFKFQLFCVSFKNNNLSKTSYYFSHIF